MSIFGFGTYYQFESNLGNIKLNQHLNTSVSLSYRDDEIFNFLYSVPIIENVELITIQNLFLTQNTSNNITNNKLQRLNAGLGLRIPIIFKQKIELIYGQEQNTFDFVKTIGTLYKINLINELFNYDGYRFKPIFNYELLSLNDNRKNIDLIAEIESNKKFEYNEGFDISMRYKIQNRNYLRQFTNFNDYNIQTKYEDKIAGNISFLFSTFTNFNSTVKINIENQKVFNDFKYNLAEYTETGVRKEINVFQLGLEAESSYKIDNLQTTFGFAFQSRDEQNRISNKFEIGEIEFKKLRDLQSQWDNNSLIRRMYTKISYALTNYDTLNFDYYVYLLKYDTPSELNDYDRDEFSTYGRINYKHKFSEIFSGGVNFDLQGNHFVNLQATRSIDNNWNRVIKLSPYFNIQTDTWHSQPQFEVLANYSIYDFEDAKSSIKSYSFRQINFKDTIYLKLDDKISLQSKIFVRYFENGVLFWENFSEIPQNSKMELFTKLMIVNNFSSESDFGFGMRYYKQDQKSLISNLSLGQSLKQLSWGPECMIVYKFQSGSNVQFSGWYEFQYFFNKLSKEIANIYITTKIAL
ncbi:MAG: hypothetical protein NTW25_08660 [Candidatus Kapabacteria bacterium]|nr:hypothetical protein [Candidatus Kapabacteria bacterium]